MPLDVIAHFVDRTEELARFHCMLAGETDRHILCILERGEQGKSYFLLRLFHECEQQRPPVPVVLLDFDRRKSGLTDCFSVGSQVRRHLGDERTPTICACEEAIHVSIFTAPPAPEQMARQKEELGRALRDDLARLDRAVVLVDTFEHASEETRGWLERWLFEPLRRGLCHVILVVAGRPECQSFFAQPCLDYAMTQNNLGAAYRNLPTGDRAANLTQAIACYQEALRFRTPEAAPLDYATTQNNLGTAYADLPTGERAANLARAIQCYQEALRFYTPEAAPLDYAMTQNNLGLAYAHLPTGDRAANLREALQCAEAALQFEGWSPWERSECLFTRGLIHLALGHLDQALADYRAAVPLATAITVTEALQELDRFAAAHPNTPGLDAVRALLKK